MAGTTKLTSLSNDDLYDLFRQADESQDDALARSCIDEILRRADLPSPTQHDVPDSLQWLPRAFWHQKPVGQGSDERYTREEPDETRSRLQALDDLEDDPHGTRSTHMLGWVLLAGLTCLTIVCLLVVIWLSLQIRGG